MRAFVTGATGFLGRALTRHLLENGDQVRVLVRSRRRVGPDPVEELRGHGAEVVEGELFDAPLLARALSGAEVVFHLAWQWNRASVPGAPGGTADEQWQANVDGTYALIRACQSAAAGRFVFTSTVAVYGRASVGEGAGPIREEDATGALHGFAGGQFDDYVAPKIAVENMIRELLPRPDFVIFRPSMIYGAGAQWAAGMVRNLAFGPPRRTTPQALQWIHVRDAAQALALGARAPQAANGIFNLAGGETVSSDAFHNAIRHLANRLLQGRMDDQYDDPFRLIGAKYDIAKARDHLGFAPGVRLVDGLAEMIAAALPAIMAGAAGPQSQAPPRWGPAGFARIGPPFGGARQGRAGGWRGWGMSGARPGWARSRRGQ